MATALTMTGLLPNDRVFSPMTGGADRSPTSDLRLPSAATLVEVGPRDGLQSESLVLAVSDRVELIRRLVETKVTRIEVASFVHPSRVPQMAEAEALLESLGISPPGVSYIGLVLNERGLERAMETTVDEINFVAAASDGYNQSNQGVPVSETLAAVEQMTPVARSGAKKVSLTVSAAFGDPYDGEVDPVSLGVIAARGAAAGVDEIALGDTIGVATPAAVAAAVSAVAGAAPNVGLRCHFHNTRNSGLANLYAALQAGVTVLDTSVGGIGGSPFAPGSGGNVATEDAAFFLGRLGVDHGLDINRVIETGVWLGERLGRVLPAALQHVPAWP